MWRPTFAGSDARISTGCAALYRASRVCRLLEACCPVRVGGAGAPSISRLLFSDSSAATTGFEPKSEHRFSCFPEHIAFVAAAPTDSGSCPTAFAGKPNRLESSSREVFTTAVHRIRTACLPTISSRTIGRISRGVGCAEGWERWRCVWRWAGYAPGRAATCTPRDNPPTKRELAWRVQGGQWNFDSSVHGVRGANRRR